MLEKTEEAVARWDAAVLLVATLIAVPVPFHSTLLPAAMVGVVMVTVVASMLFVVVHVLPLSVEYETDCSNDVGTFAPIVSVNVPDSMASKVR